MILLLPRLAPGAGHHDRVPADGGRDGAVPPLLGPRLPAHARAARAASPRRCRRTCPACASMQAFGREETNLANFRSRQRRATATPTCRPSHANACYFPFVELLSTLGTAIVLGYGGWLYIQGDVETRHAGRVHRLPDELLRPGAAALAALQHLPAAQRGARQDLRRARHRADARRPAGRRRPADDRRRGRLRRRPLRLPRRPRGAARPRRCTPTPGQTVALVGHTGAGKSTHREAARALLRPAPRARSASTGTTCATSRRRRCASQIGIVPQEGFLFAATIRENIAFGRPDAHRGGRARGGRAPSAPRLHRGAAGRLRHGGAGARRAAVDRAAAADRARARAARRPAPADPGRGHVARRPRDRGAHRGGDRDALLAGRTVVRRRPPPVHHPPRRPDRRARERPRRRERQPRRAARARAAATGRSTATGWRRRARDGAPGPLPCGREHDPAVPDALPPDRRRRADHGRSRTGSCRRASASCRASSSSRASWWWRCGSSRAGSSTGRRARPPPPRGASGRAPPSSASATWAPPWPGPSPTRATPPPAGRAAAAPDRRPRPARRPTWSSGACSTTTRPTRSWRRPASPRRSPARPSCSWRPAARPMPARWRLGERRRRRLPRRLDRDVPRPHRRRADDHLLLGRPRRLRPAPRDAGGAGRPPDVRRRGRGRRGRRRPGLAVVPVREHDRPVPGRRVPGVGGRRRVGRLRCGAVVRHRDRRRGGAGAAT